MAGVTTTPEDEKIRIFVSFSYQDEQLMQDLLKHLRAIDRLGQTEIWHGRKIKPGEIFSKEIREHLESADLFLLLISPDFIASKYCYEIEAMKALERAEAGQATIIPVMLRPIFWDKLPLSALQALPKNGKPIVTWLVQDEALRDVVQGVWTIVKDLQSARSVGQVAQLASSLQQAEFLSPDVHARQTEQMQLDPSLPLWGRLSFQQGQTFFRQGGYEQALQAYEMARQFAPTDPVIYQAIQDCLMRLKRPDEAVDMQQTNYPEAIQCCKYGDILRAQGDYEGALQAYERAIFLEPTRADAYRKKGDLHQLIGQRLAALEAYARAQELMDE